MVVNFFSQGYPIQSAVHMALQVADEALAERQRIRPGLIATGPEPETQYITRAPTPVGPPTAHSQPVVMQPIPEQPGAPAPDVPLLPVGENAALSQFIATTPGGQVFVQTLKEKFGITLQG